MLDYLNELRESILSAYSAIIQGMCSENATSPIESHLPFILEFIKTVAIDEDLNDETICACVALIGYGISVFCLHFLHYIRQSYVDIFCVFVSDLCTIFGTKVIPKLDTNITNNLLQQARRSTVTKTKNYGLWVTKELRKLTRTSWLVFFSLICSIIQIQKSIVFFIVIKARYQTTTHFKKSENICIVTFY